MMDSAAEVSEYLLAYPTLSFHAWAVIMLIGILILLAYPTLSFYPPVVNEAEGNETSSRLSPLSFYPLVVNEAEGDETSSRLSPTIVLPSGSQRSRRERIKLSTIPYYRSTRR